MRDYIEFLEIFFENLLEKKRIILVNIEDEKKCL